MPKTVMAKLDTLDDIQKRTVCVEQYFKQMKTSLEFAHTEIKHLKDEVERIKKSENEIQHKMCKLEESNRLLQESVIDLKARSMRDNLFFYNVEEEERENTDENIYQILEEKLQIPDARNKIKIDQSHIESEGSITRNTSQEQLLSSTILKTENISDLMQESSEEHA
jgi:hypothetical protein